MIEGLVMIYKDLKDERSGFTLKFGIGPNIMKTPHLYGISLISNYVLSKRKTKKSFSERNSI